MNTQDILTNTRKVITHRNCPDGIASAIILNAMFGGRVPIEFCAYGKERNELEPEPGLLFCDFSPPDSKAQEFLDAGAVVLDHHDGNKATTLRFVEAGQGMFGDETAEPDVSGAMLALRLCRSCADIGSVARSILERIAILAGVRDLWQKHRPEWQEACEQAAAFTFWPIRRLLDASVAEELTPMLSLGPLLMEKRAEKVKREVGKLYRFKANTTRVAVSSRIDLVSDVAEAVGDDADLVAAFSVDPVAKQILYSIRSQTGRNCMAFAKELGGGGHQAAAGFEKEFDPKCTENPFWKFQRFVHYCGWTLLKENE